jgi:hypothetical protein
MAGSIIALLMGFQAAALVPIAPPADRQTDPHPGMVFNPVTGQYVPIVGRAPASGRRDGLPAGTKLRYNRLGRKIGAAPIGH